MNQQEEDIFKNVLKEEEWSQEKQQLLANERKAKLDRYNDAICRKNNMDKRLDKKTKSLSILIKFIIALYYIAVIIIYIIIDNDMKNIFLGILAIVPPMFACICTLIANKSINVLEIINVLCSCYRNSKAKKVYLLYEINIEEIARMEEELEILK